MVNSPGDTLLTDQIKGLRRQLVNEIGFVMPAARIQDNTQLPANSYMIHFKEISASDGEVRPNSLLVMDPRGDKILARAERIRLTASGVTSWTPSRKLPSTFSPVYATDSRRDRPINPHVPVMV